VYPLKNKKSQEVLTAAKQFLMHSHLATQIWICDNGPCFRDKKFLTFMASLGIEVPSTVPYSSKSRGSAEAMVKRVSALLKKLLLTSPSFDFSDCLFLTAVLLNNSTSPAIGVAPAAVLHGEALFQYGPLGTKRRQHPVQARLLNESLRPQVQALRDLISKRTAAALAQLKKIRAKTAKAYNKAKKFSHGLQKNDIVFIVNHSIAPAGTSPKLRPRLYKSPFLVVSTGARAATVMRLSDGFQTKIHVDHLRRYTSKNHALFSQLPQEVLKLLGQPFTPESLAEFARVDTLDLLFLDKLPLPRLKGRVDKTKTRAASAKQKLQHDLDALEDTAPVWDDDEWEDDDIVDPRRVRFSDSPPQEFLI
jgi:hypothetical protein